MIPVSQVRTNRQGDILDSIKTLIVEDNALFRQTLREILLSQFPILEIAEAESGKEALQKIAKEEPDLIFMDIKLPDENGLLLTRKIKARNSKAIIIVLTSYDFPEYREAAFLYGTNYFIVKGSSSNTEILNLVGAILEDLRKGKNKEALSPT